VGFSSTIEAVTFDVKVAVSAWKTAMLPDVNEAAERGAEAIAMTPSDVINEEANERFWLNNAAANVGIMGGKYF